MSYTLNVITDVDPSLGRIYYAKYTNYTWTGRWKLVTRGNASIMFLERKSWLGLFTTWVSEFDFEWLEDEPETIETIYECAK